MRFRAIAWWMAFLALLLLASISRVRAQEAAGPGPATPPASSEQAPGAAGNAQPSTNTPALPVPVLHSEAHVVRVDVIVTDKKGKYIRDLTAKDFQVFDNDKEQQIVNFSFGSSAGVGGPPDRHYMVLFFDDSTMDMGDQGRARQAALKFIDANAGPDRVMAVVDFTGVLHIRQNFTADAARLKLAAQNSRPSAVTSNPSDSDPSAPGLSDAQTDFSVYTMLLGLRSLAKDLRDVPGRKSVVLFTSGFLSTPEVEAELTATISACNQANVAVYPLDVRGLIAPMPGHSQLLTPGDSVSRASAANPAPAAREIAEGRPKLILAAYRMPSAAASEPQKGGGGGGRGGGGGPMPGGGGGRPAGPVGTGPTSGPGSLPYSPGNIGGIGGMPSNMIVPQLPDTGVGNQSVLWELAEGTGGFTILNTNDLLGGLAKISDEQNEYYLLGYAPTDAEDGSCHSLRVKVEHGLKVRARTGYCTAKSSDMLAGKPVEKELEQRAAAAATGPLGGSLEAPFFYTSPNEARVNVAMDIPSSSIVFAKDKGTYHGEINVLGIAYRNDGSVGARFSDEVKLDLEKDAWKKFLESPMQYQNQFTIAPGNYKLTVILSAGGQNFGKYETPLVIDPYNGQTFSLSALALSNHLQAAAGLGASMEAALLADHTPLVAGGVEVVPSGSNRFKKREMVALYAQIYDPKLATSDKSDVKVIFRVVDTKTGKAVIEPENVDPAQFIQKGNPVVALGFKLPLDTLAPGTYRLDMQAFDPSGARSKVRTVTFEEE
jgi:VWFA-related protein